jgi:hypothetical protein
MTTKLLTSLLMAALLFQRRACRPEHRGEHGQRQQQAASA